ncbi:MAG: adenylate/guanylate cyclase domain-containing protein [Elusimicrobia bacterium]|nr:adenylate/guanylate cyclase domain-containing protein [Elusimicrobiota bacterium]
MPLSAFIRRLSAKAPRPEKAKAGAGGAKGPRARWLVAAPIIFSVCFLDITGFLRTLEYNYVDFLFTTRLAFWGVGPVDSRLAAAVMDEKSMAEIGAIPWPRSVYADLVKKLMKHGAEMVVFDVLFIEPDKRHPEEDVQLVAVTRRWKKRVIHCFYETIEASPNGLITVQQLMPFDALKEAGMRIAFVDTDRIKGKDLEKAGDLDGTVRRAFLAKQLASGDYSLSLGAEVFAALKGLTPQEFVGRYPDEIHVNFPGIFKTLTQGGKIIPKDPYPKIPIADIVADRLSDKARQALKGAVVFVASVATGYYDHYPTPYDPVTPGVSLHLYALNNLLLGNYLRVWPGLLTILLTISSGFLLAVALERYSAVFSFGVLAAMLAGMFGFSLYLFVYKNVIFHVLLPGVTSLLVSVGVTLYRVAVEEKEKRWIRNTFSQYLSPKVVSLLVENPEALRLGGDKRLMTVLFLDIEGFTTISEKLSPEDLTKLLNKYLTSFTDIILKNDGVVDKFIGDAVMAFWNAPFDQSQHPLSACLAALEMKESVARMTVSEVVPIKIRIGLHTGFMIVGNMGSSARFNYTVVGDSVNFASRLEGANKFFKTSILISESVYEVVKAEVVVRDLGKIRVVGKETPVGIYELLGRKNGKVPLEEALPIWERAMAALKQNDAASAKNAFWEYMKLHPKDPAAERYLKLLDLGVKENFVINLTEK